MGLESWFKCGIEDRVKVTGRMGLEKKRIAGKSREDKKRDEEE